MDSDSVNLGSNPSSPANEILAVPKKTTIAHSEHREQTAHKSRTKVGTA